MDAMDEEIKANAGVYPHNRGRITQTEVCRRAAVSKVTLQGPAHKTTTKVDVDSWVAAHNIKSAPEVQRATSDRADRWKADHHKVATQYAIAMLDLVEAENRIRALESQNAALREQLALSGKLVHLVPAP